MSEAHANALQAIIGAFKNISPEITNAFIFKANSEIVASDGITTDEKSKNLAASFNCISSKAEIIGGIKTVAMQGADRQLSITSMNNQYLATVFSREADEKVVKSLTCVLVPAVVGLMDELSESGLAKAVKFEDKSVEEAILPTPDPLLPEPPVTQFMVEKIGGLLVRTDIVRVNGDVIAKWRNLYGDKQITEIHIETLEGKKTTCKFMSTKEANGNARGVIQIPEKILQTLQTSKGKLVIVKPVIT